MVGMLGMAALAGCSSDDVAAPNPTLDSESETVTVSTTVTEVEGSETAKPNPTQAAAETTAETATSTETVSTKTDSEAQSEAVAKANELHNLDGYDEEWVVASSAFDPNSDLSYVTVVMSKTRFSNLVALYHKGEFVRFATDEPGEIDYVTPTSEGLEMGFHDAEAFLASGEPLANSRSFNKPVLFYWDGEKIVQEG